VLGITSARLNRFSPNVKTTSPFFMVTRLAFPGNASMLAIASLTDRWRDIAVELKRCAERSGSYRRRYAPARNFRVVQLCVWGPNINDPSLPFPVVVSAIQDNGDTFRKSKPLRFKSIGFQIVGAKTTFEFRLRTSFGLGYIDKPSPAPCRIIMIRFQVWLHCRFTDIRRRPAYAKAPKQSPDYFAVITSGRLPAG
jgi:hypothetical protein